ncbi:transcriptional repressor LexA [Inhella sp.]|uniref:transcriptional repressor LexA n=1 Tax=Inhella sp. TaxID=1921806 RepID=UPI0035B14CC1
MNAPLLTPRQQQILDLVRRSIERTGSPPTRAEIAEILGFRSANSAEEHLQALARKGVIELIGGTSRGIRLKSDQLKLLRKRSSPSEQMELPMPGLAQLPLIGRVAAGHPILAVEHVEAQYALPLAIFSARPDFLLRVRGQSMRDAGILDGDLLAVKQAVEAVNGQIVVARLGEEVTVKRWRRDAEGAWLIPENPAFKPIRVPSSGEDFAIEGHAVGLLRGQLGNS